ncbi:hypothetical protein [Alkalibacterium sp. 20]|uniref:hypothetical protein n=1 Tax=Alkalibacterium sp. 20 TaxID=1798803 RepID=UPI001C43385D|nr:hypothetical protein [Alkalibacterium sp. 20]
MVEIVKPIALAIITLLVGLIVIKVIVKLIGSQISRSKLDESLKPFLMSIVSIGLKYCWL